MTYYFKQWSTYTHINERRRRVCMTRRAYNICIIIINLQKLYARSLEITDGAAGNRAGPPWTSRFRRTRTESLGHFRAYILLARSSPSMVHIILYIILCTYFMYIIHIYIYYMNAFCSCWLHAHALTRPAPVTGIYIRRIIRYIGTTYSIIITFYIYIV